MSCCNGTNSVKISDQGVQAKLMEYDYKTENETIVRLRDVGCDNIATDKNADGTASQLKTYVKHMTMSSISPPLTTHILDTTIGVPAANVQFILSVQNTNGGYDEVERGLTNNDGRGGMLKGSILQPDVYKLRFETDAYYKRQNTEGFYPYVEIVFRVTDPSSHYHVPLILTPYGYTTYRGS